MSFWTIMLWLLLIAAVVCAVVIPIFYSRGSCNSNSSSTGGCCSSGRTKSVHAAQTGLLVVTAEATGPTGGNTGTIDYVNIMSKTMYTCDDTNGLIIQVSAQTSIATTDIAANDLQIGQAQTSLEVAQINLRVLLDDVVVGDPITFDGVAHVLAETMSPDQLRIELDALAHGHTYNWIATNITPGRHTIKVQAELTAVASVINSLYAAAAAQISEAVLVVQPTRF
jgi:hypothetical protein